MLLWNTAVFVFVTLRVQYAARDLILGIDIGVLHVVLNSPDTKIGLVPCDYVNNAIISAGKEASHSLGGESTKIYVVSSNVRNPIIQRNLSSLLDGLRNIASPKTVYYNYSLQISNKLLFLVLTWLVHLIPAYIVDFVCLLLGKERRFVKIAKKVYKITNALSYFLLNHWLFVDENLEGLHKSLSETDKIIFNFDIANIDWAEYVPIWAIGIRKYIIKDGLKGTEYAIRKQF